MAPFLYLFVIGKKSLWISCYEFRLRWFWDSFPYLCCSNLFTFSIPQALNFYYFSLKLEERKATKLCVLLPCFLLNVSSKEAEWVN